MFEQGLMKGQRILVTGGGSGLGREMADRLAQLGADLVICGRRRGVLEDAAGALERAHGVKVEYHDVDLRDAASVEAMVANIFASEKPLTGLINNAAGNFISRTQDLSPRGFDAIANTVLHGTFYVTQAVGKRWIANQQQGSIVSIVVSWVWTGAPFVVPSAMSKAGIDVMTKSLAVEWGRYGIRLNAIAPGIFPTEGATARLRPGDNPHAIEIAGNPMRRLGRMAELQNLAAFLVAPGCEWLNGQTICIDGGYHLAQGAYFTQYMDWTDQQWKDARDRITAMNERDKAQRTAKPN